MVDYKLQVMCHTISGHMTRRNSCGHKRTTFKLVQQRSHYMCKSPVWTKFDSFDSGKSIFYILLNSRGWLFKMIGPLNKIRKLLASNKIWKKKKKLWNRWDLQQQFARHPNHEKSCLEIFCAGGIEILYTYAAHLGGKKRYLKRKSVTSSLLVQWRNKRGEMDPGMSTVLLQGHILLVNTQTRWVTIHQVSPFLFSCFLFALIFQTMPCSKISLRRLNSKITKKEKKNRAKL